MKNRALRIHLNTFQKNRKRILSHFLSRKLSPIHKEICRQISFSKSLENLSSTSIPLPTSRRLTRIISTKDGCTVFYTRSLVRKSECSSNFDNTMKTIRFETEGVRRKYSSIISWNFKNRPLLLLLHFGLRVFVFVLIPPNYL